MPTQTEQQRQATFQAAGMQPAATAPVTPTPQIQTPAAPAPTPAAPAPTPAPVQVNVGTQPAPQTSQQPTQGPLTMPSSGSVIDLLNSAGQASDFESRKKLADQYGIAGYTGTGPQNIDLSKKYLEAYNANKNLPTPETGAAARGALDTYFSENQTSQEDPQKSFFDNYMAMNPVVKTMYDTIHNELSHPATTQSFKDEFDKLRKDQDIPELNTQLMNIKNIMDGTEDDIRNEITKAGGFATDSQVQALAAARNKTLLKQANVLQQQLAIKNDYVDQIMQFSEKDRAQVDKEVEKKLGLTEKLAKIQETMTKAAKENYQKIVDKIGYEGLASALDGDKNAMSVAEKSLGLSKGALSNKTFLSSQMLRSTPTSSIQEYEYAKKQGYTGSFTQYQNEDANRKRSIAAAGVPQITYDENGNLIQTGNYDALTIGRYNKAANAATAVLQKNPTFKNIIGSSAYLDRIESAVNNPGSVGDQELLDAFTQLNTGGNRVTEAQVNLITHNQSYADWLSKAQNKFKTGGSLSNQQRQEIVNLSRAVYRKYQDSYRPLYNEAASRLEAQGIPKQFWNIPSPDTLSRAVGDSQSSTIDISKGTKDDRTFISNAVQASGRKYDEILSKIPKGQIAVADNATGQIGYIPAEDFNSSQYTRL